MLLVSGCRRCDIIRQTFIFYSQINLVVIVRVKRHCNVIYALTNKTPMYTVHKLVAPTMFITSSHVHIIIKRYNVNVCAGLMFNLQQK